MAQLIKLAKREMNSKNIKQIKSVQQQPVPREKCQFVTMSTQTRNDFNTVVEREGFQKSLLLRSWVMDFIAENDKCLPVSRYDQPWSGMSSAPPMEKIQFLITADVKKSFRSRAKNLGVQQTVMIRAWIEAFCAKNATLASSPIIENEEQADSDEDKVFRAHIPTDLKEKFFEMCEAEGRVPNSVLAAWVGDMAKGRQDSLPPIAQMISKRPRMAKFAVDGETAYMRLDVPEEVLAQAMKVSRDQGRDLRKTLILWMRVCIHLKRCSDFKKPAVQGGKPGGAQVVGSLAVPAAPNISGNKVGGVEFDTYFTAPVTKRLKNEFDKKCKREGAVPALVLRSWLCAFRDGDDDVLPDAASNEDDAELAERDKWETQARTRISKADLAIIKKKAMASGSSMSRVARGWMRGYLARV